MTQADVVIQAKQGNPTAIAALLNRSLQARGITVTAQLQENCLTLELASAQTIDQKTAIAFIQQGMNRLQPEQIHSVLVCARLAAVTDLEWMESFWLQRSLSDPAEVVSESASSELIALEPIPLPNVHGAIAKPTSRTNSPIANGSKTATKLKPKAVSTKGIEALLIGLVLAIVLFRVGLLKTLFYGFVILVHEVGHAITHWAFGRPAIPTVNLYYGGGITITFGQVWFINGMIYAAIAYLLYRFRGYPRLQGVGVLLTLIYTYWLFTPTNLMLSVAMGHGMELVAIAVCLYLAASGYWCRIPGDRAIYAMLGFFVWFKDIEFSWQLLHDSDFRELYEGGIGGVLDNDLVILANEYFQVNLSTVANAFLMGCFLAPAIAVLVYICEPWCFAAYRKLLQQP